jgi:feruloyl esterase
VEAARRIYSSSRNPRTGAEIFPGMAPGSELVWATLAGGPKPFALADDHFKYVVFENPDWDFRTLNFDSDLERATRAERGVLAVTEPSFREFFSHGGKLIHYHGWTDQQVVSSNSINFYNSVAKGMGGIEKTKDSYRLFMAPGMNHCSGGDGPNSFDSLSALEGWVESRTAPEQMIASHRTDGKVDRTRPLCPYPQVAKYKGTGSTDDAANFTCASGR